MKHEKDLAQSFTFESAVLLAVTLVAASIWVGLTHAQGYPSKPVRVIVPTPPGGFNDILARMIASQLAARLNQQFVVDNRSGGGGNIGMEIAARSAPDGYTLVIGHSGTLSINPALHRTMPYDPIKDFAPISLVAVTPLVLAVHPVLPAKTVRQLVALAKSKPDQLNLASAGNGTVSHLVGEYFKTVTDAKLLHVPYKGTATGLTAVISGESQMIFSVIPPALAQVTAGRLRALATTGAKRITIMPDVPTVIESGYAGFDASARYGVLAPAGTPAEIITRLNAEIARAVQRPEVASWLAADGAEPAAGTPEAFSAMIKAELATWAKVVKASGARID